MKPQKLYSLTDLLDYFIGTQGHEIWEKRTEIKEWFAEHSVLDHKIRICEISDHPYSLKRECSAMVNSFCGVCLQTFGTHDYHINPLQPCGGWKFLKIIVN